MALLDDLKPIRDQIRAYLKAYRNSPNKEAYKATARQLLNLEKIIRRIEREQQAAAEANEEPTSPEAPVAEPQYNQLENARTTAATLSASVGEGGVNRQPDVRLVQKLLTDAGHPATADGFIGPQTIAAIRAFQKTLFNGWSDGRIDPGGTTFQRLQARQKPEPTPEPTPTPATELQQSVGKGGVNRAADVRLVQTLLNRVHAGLSVDGQIGPGTIGAIERYQHSIFNGWSDGRIEPGKTTWKKLQAGEGDADQTSLPIAGDGSYQKFRLGGGHIASIPDGASGTVPLVVLFGGASYANPEWMLSQTPRSYHQRALVYIVPQRTGFAAAKSAYTAFFNGKGLKVGAVSICGFSGGGQDVQFASGSFKVKGLIDPYTVPDWVGRNLGSNVIMEYNAYNWGGPYVSTRNALPKLADAVRRQGGYAASASVSHKGFPSYFLNKFANKIL